LHGGIINATNAYVNGGDLDDSKDIGNSFNQEDLIDNAVKNGGDVLTLSMFYRPTKDNAADYYTSDGLA